MGKSDGTILFRHLGDDVAPNCIPGHTWQVEYYEGRSFPAGVIWVAAPPQPGKGRKRRKRRAPDDYRPYVKFVLVADDSRRQGIATRLIEACLRRWPDLEIGLPVSEGGLALYRKFQPPVTPERHFNKEFIERFLKEGGTREELEEMVRESHENLLTFAGGIEGRAQKRGGDGRSR